MDAPDLYGLVLSGGKSTRMGVDKASLHYHGQPQLHHLVGLLNRFCKRVFVSARKDQVVGEGLTYLHDRFEIGGPMNGILSALTCHPGHAWLIVAIDMPNVSDEVLELLINNRDCTKLATCFFNTSENFPEPLLTIWEPASLSPLRKFVDMGEISPRKFLRTNDVRFVEVTDSSILLNINSPDELRKFKGDLSKD